MRAVDLIQKKKMGLEHTEDEIYFLVENYMNGTIEDYQMSAWLMAVYFKGLTYKETAYLTKSYIKSGDILDFSDVSDFIADKHSTGGVGDKVTLVLIPILASFGIHCAKLSGRGLGFTGGTIDKLESIPNFKTELNNVDFKNQIKSIGAAISSQSPNLTPADGKIYALRDVTATVDNMSLIAASVLSKKIASGATSIVLDVKYGSGAFLKTKESARELSDLMVKIAQELNKKVDIVISSMDEPLGKNIGNSLEVVEAIEFLKGNYEQDLYDVVLEIVQKTLKNKNKDISDDGAKELMDKVLKDKSALNKLREIIKAQKGNDSVIDNYTFFKQPKNKYELVAQDDFNLNHIDALKIANSARLLGAGRDKKSDKIDYSAGISLNIKKGDVKKGDVIMTLYYDNIDSKRLDEAIDFAKCALLKN